MIDGSASSSKHYMIGEKEPIEIMQEAFTHEEMTGFLKGNIVKYVLRFGRKDDVRREAAKIEQYAKWLRVHVSGGKINPKEDKQNG